MRPNHAVAVAVVCLGLVPANRVLATAPLPPPDFWPTGGLAVAAGPSAQRLADIASDGEGGAFVAWTDQPSQFIPSDIYLQHVTAQGIIDWDTGPSGFPVYASYGWQLGVRLLPDGSGGVIAAWYDDGSSGRHEGIYALRVQRDGRPQPGWPANGMAVCATRGNHSAPILASDGQGGAYVVWRDPRDADSHVYAQHILEAGVIASGWPPGGLRVGSGTGIESQPAVAAGPAGSVYVSWVDENQDPSSANVYLTRIGFDGLVMPGWPASGLVVTAAQGRQDMPTVVPGHGGGVYVVWRDYRDQPANDRSDIYAKSVSRDGWFPTGWGPTGTPVRADSIDQGVPVAASDGDDGLLVSWCSESGVYVQRLSDQGSPAPGWPDGGVSVGTSTATGQGSSICDDGEGGAFVTWNDSRGPSPLDVYAQHLSPAGVPAYDWPEGGAPVSAGGGVEMMTAGDPRASTNVRGWYSGSLVAWTSGLEGSRTDVYIQFITNGGKIGPWGTPWGSSCCNALERLSPNPTRGSIRLQVRIPRGGTSGVLNVYDALGRRVRAKPCDGLRAGWGNPVDIDLTGLPSGVYYVKISERAGGPVMGRASVVVVR